MIKALCLLWRLLHAISGLGGHELPVARLGAMSWIVEAEMVARRGCQGSRTDMDQSAEKSEGLTPVKITNPTITAVACAPSLVVSHRKEEWEEHWPGVKRANV